MKHVLLVSGKINAGKNEIYEIVNKYYKKNAKVEREYFARPVKDLSNKVFKNYVVYMNKTVKEVISDLDDLKEDTDGIKSKLLPLITNPDNWYENKTDTTRLLLQTLGTDIFRNHVSDTYWIRKAADSISDSDSDIFVLTDFRFENEYTDLEEILLTDCDNAYQFHNIRLEREIDRDSELIHRHESENSLDLVDKNFWDCYIDNNGNLAELTGNIIKYLSEAITIGD
jgi:hypothetical protein